MSVTISYFFNSIHKLSHLKTVVERSLGCQLEPDRENDTDLFCRLLSTEVSLGVHNLENDGECDFENFEFSLRARTAVTDMDLRAVQVEIVAVVAYVLFRRASINEGLLVFDLQIPLARYESRETTHGIVGWYDLLLKTRYPFLSTLSTCILGLADLAGRRSEECE